MATLASTRILSSTKLQTRTTNASSKRVGFGEHSGLRSSLHGTFTSGVEELVSAPCTVCRAARSSGGALKTEAKLKVAINGFGRIGRNFLRCWHGREDSPLDVVVLNDSGGVKNDLGLGKMSLNLMSPTEPQSGYMPIFRSGSWYEMGTKSYMEDEHVCIDNLVEHLNAPPSFPAPGAFYGVFDGHCGTDAARFVKTNLLKFIIEDNHFPNSLHKVIRSAFMKADHALADSNSLDCSSGTTVLTALIFDRTLLIANLGDCRAVLSKRGKAVDLTKDHKPTCKFEKVRIEKLGGTVFDGYLNGQLSVSRALGDWHMKGVKGSVCALSGEPELHEAILTQEDEFLILACDGLWDVMSSQCAITMVRKSLMNHNDPKLCSRELVREALERNSCDNLTALVICFSPDPPPRIEVPRWKVRKCISMEAVSTLQGALDAD